MYRYKCLLAIILSILLTVPLRNVPQKRTARICMSAVSASTEQSEFKTESCETLLPFVGRVYEFHSAIPEFADRHIYKAAYGLMTASGVRVSSPIYSSAVTRKLDNGDSILVLERDCDDPRNPEALCRILTVASSDGSKVLSFTDGSLISCSDGRIVISDFDISDSSSRIHLYDYSLRRLNVYSGCESFFGFHDGYLYLVSTENSCNIIIGNEGTVVFTNVDLAFPFKNGIAPASSNGRYGIIRINGEWCVEPHFDSVQTIGKNSEYIHLLSGNSGILVKDDGSTVRRYIDPLGTREYYIANGEPVFVRNNRAYSDDGTPVRCENGAYASQFNPDSELFFGTVDGTGYIFDINGSTVNSLKGAVGMNAYNFHDGYYCMHTENGETTVSVIYRADTNREVYRFVSHGRASHTFLLKIAPNGIAAFSQMNELNGNEIYRLIDLNTGRVLADNCLRAEISQVGSTFVFGVCRNDKIIIRDNSYRLLFAVPNKLSD